MNLIIDIGNTRTKLALFDDDQLIELYTINSNEITSLVLELERNSHPIEQAILSSVISLEEIDFKNLTYITENLFQFSHTSKLPFVNKYHTPSTLGLDRLALVAAAVDQFPNKNCLVIDAGTCITYDFVNNKKEYLGGAISPGIQMRYKSLFDYTSRLPKLEPVEDFYLTGNSTQNSIHSGILNGIVFEIDEFINQYKSKYQDLTVVLTGGDVKFLSRQLKNSIFANQNFLLEGLNTILKFNN